MMIDIVFDGPPGPEGPRFVESEDMDGKGISAGEWIHREDGYWALRIDTRPDVSAIVGAAREVIPDLWHYVSDGHDDAAKRVAALMDAIGYDRQ